jgi:thioredoxin-related protein
MNSLYRKLELLANTAIILVVVLIAGALIRNHFMSTRQEAIAGIPVGSKISLPDIDWAKNDQTLILVLQKGCRFCKESAPFYQRLVRETAGYSNLQLVAALPNTVNDSKQYLSDLGISLNEVRQVSLSSLGVEGTPSLILVDRAGKVAASWVGQLPPDKEAEVLKHFQVNNAANKLRETNFSTN